MPALALNGTFQITVEVVPPAGPDPGPLLQALRGLHGLPFAAFSVATNPLARPRLSALALSALIQREVGCPAILHCTTRDHNRLSLQALLWGAKALGIETVLVATGDFVALGDRARTTTVRDVDVFGLVQMAREAGLQTGVVLDPRPESNGLRREVRRLRRKAEAGAQFAVTQPVYDRAGALELAEAVAGVGLPLFLGILPLRSARHAWFLHEKVAGIVVPEAVRQRMAEATDPVAEGVALAREMLRLARETFAGACLMPPFDRYEVVREVLAP
ncbi:MAG: methylenetetrahydrofolate reductase [Anaerolineae bacterium]